MPPDGHIDPIHSLVVIQSLPGTPLIDGFGSKLAVRCEFGTHNTQLATTIVLV